MFPPLHCVSGAALFQTINCDQMQKQITDFFQVSWNYITIYANPPLDIDTVFARDWETLIFQTNLVFCKYFKSVCKYVYMISTAGLPIHVM